jgi:hypothetical protein
MYGSGTREGTVLATTDQSSASSHTRHLSEALFAGNMAAASKVPEEEVVYSEVVAGRGTAMRSHMAGRAVARDVGPAVGSPPKQVGSSGDGGVGSTNEKARSGGSGLSGVSSSTGDLAVPRALLDTPSGMPKDKVKEWRSARRALFDHPTMETLLGLARVVVGVSNTRAAKLLDHAVQISPDHTKTRAMYAIFLETVMDDADGAETHYKAAATSGEAVHLHNYALFLRNVRGDDRAAAKLEEQMNRKIRRHHRRK